MARAIRMWHLLGALAVFHVSSPQTCRPVVWLWRLGLISFWSQVCFTLLAGPEVFGGRVNGEAAVYDGKKADIWWATVFLLLFTFFYTVMHSRNGLKQETLVLLQVYQPLPQIAYVICRGIFAIPIMVSNTYLSVQVLSLRNAPNLILHPVSKSHCQKALGVWACGRDLSCGALKTSSMVRSIIAVSHL